MKKISEAGKIIKSHRGLAIKIYTSEKIANSTFYKIIRTGVGSDDFKNKIYCYLVENNYIKLGEYTLKDLFRIKEIKDEK